MIVIGKISKGHNSLKTVDGVTVLILCTSSDGALFEQCFIKIFLMSFKLYGDTILIRKNSKGHNSVKM